MSNKVDETYNGYGNRETWCAALWLDNDEGFYNAVNEMSREAIRSFEAGPNESEPKENIDTAVYFLAKKLQDYVEDLMEFREGNDALVRMFDDISSLWRVNWNELAQGYIEMAMENEKYSNKK